MDSFLKGENKGITPQEHTGRGISKIVALMIKPPPSPK